MNIKLKAAIDAAVIVGTCIAGAGVFGAIIHYAPWVGLGVAIAVMSYLAYNLCLDDLKFKERHKIGETK